MRAQEGLPQLAEAGLGKRIALGALARLVLAAVVYGFLPRAIPVQVAEVQRATLQVTTEDAISPACPRCRM